MDTGIDIDATRYRIARLAAEDLTAEAALELVLEEVAAAFGASSGSIILINPDTHRLEMEVVRGLPEGCREIQLALGQGVTGWVALHAAPLLLEDVAVDPRYFPVSPAVRSEMAAPIGIGGAVTGVINLDSERAGAWVPGDLGALSQVAEEISRVVHQLWRVQMLSAKVGHLESIVAVGQDLGSKLELGELLDGITGEALSLMDCRVCALFLLDPGGVGLTLKSLGSASGAIVHKEQLNLDQSAVGAAIRHRKVIEVADLRRTEEHHFVPVVQREGLVSMLAAPIIFEEEVIGVLNAYTDRPHRFSNDERTWLGALAALSAVAIHNARLYARVFSHEDTLRKNEKLTTLGLLAAEIAHEIRNPLLVIRLLFGALDLDFEEEDPRRKDAAIIGEKLDQLEEIVGRVLTFGKSSGELRARWEVGQLLQDTLLLVRLKLHQQRIELHHQAEGGPFWALVSKGQLQQVFLNLIINATQAMPGGGRIDVVLGREAHGGDAGVALEFRDSGTGIPEEVRGRIFDTFLTGTGGGAGLGLAIVKRILESHRGRVELIETSPRGTVMKVWLPLAAE